MPAASPVTSPRLSLDAKVPPQPLPPSPPQSAPLTMSSLWTEYKNSEGRVYWSNSQTQQSVWEKPDELKTPFEKAMGKTSWKQYISKGKPYYVHSVTKETKWDMPDELVDLKERVEAEEAYRAERKRRVELGLPSYVHSPGRAHDQPHSTSRHVARVGRA